MKHRPKLVALLGPTACGKSSIALRLATELDMEIVNCDSRQIYREMEIGTAKPSAADRALVPHHLLDLVSPAEVFSAGDFLKVAAQCLNKLWISGKRTLLVGGTGFYFDALQNGLPAIHTDPEVKKMLEIRIQTGGLDALVEELRRIDPTALKRLDLANPRRVIRALEIVLSSGGTLDSARRREGVLNAEIKTFFVGIPRPSLWERIRTRVAKMVEAGLQAEVTLLAKKYGSSAPGLQSIGYSEWLSTAPDKIDPERIAGDIVVHTRQYAKRQETWFRKRPGTPMITLDCLDSYDRIRAEISDFLAT